MTNDELRKSICADLKMADRRTLKMIKALMQEYYAPDDGKEEQELYEELERRSKAYKQGKVKLLRVSEIKARYHKRKKSRGL